MFQDVDQLRSVLDSIGVEVFYVDVDEELLDDLGIDRGDRDNDDDDDDDWLYRVSLGLFRADMFC